jgi:hypothetical protein
MRKLGLAAFLMLGGCATQIGFADPGLQQAARNFPPLIVGNNTQAVSGPVAVRSCPAAGGRVEQKGGPTMEFLGASPTNPDLCVMRIEGETVQAWYGIWMTDWPGADKAYPALTRVMRSGTGDIEGFDVQMAPGYWYHDMLRNEGVEDLSLLGTRYQAIKIAHYREGFGSNGYRSVSTIWKDLASGLLLYGTYQHISGAPVVDDPLIPTAIKPAR